MWPFRSNPTPRTPVAAKNTQFLGSFVSDRITGFSGYVTGYCEYITGCNQALVTPEIDGNGSYVEPRWFDVQRLFIDTNVDRIVLDNGQTPGFDVPPPVR